MCNAQSTVLRKVQNLNHATRRVAKRKHDEMTKSPPTMNNDKNHINQLVSMGDDERAIMNFVRDFIQGSPRAKQICAENSEMTKISDN